MEREPAVLVVPPPANVNGRDHGHREASPQLVLLLIQGTRLIAIVNYLEVVQVLKHPILCCPAVFDGGILASSSTYERTEYARILELSDYAVLAVLDRDQLFALLLSGVLANLRGQIDESRDGSESSDQLTNTSEVLNSHVGCPTDRRSAACGDPPQRLQHQKSSHSTTPHSS